MTRSDRMSLNANTVMDFTWSRWSERKKVPFGMFLWLVQCAERLGSGSSAGGTSKGTENGVYMERDAKGMQDETRSHVKKVHGVCY
jgi:hypothetical protein